jgi:hypothetical protein
MEALTTSKTGAVEDASFEVISFEGVTLAMIIRDSYAKEGVNFLTPKEFPQQLAYMQHPAGKAIKTHVHTNLPRVVECTQEVLFIKQGRMRVNLYAADREYITSRVLSAGDVILLAAGGHGFDVLDDVSFIEVKQGPYVADLDKVCFQSGVRAAPIDPTQGAR